MSGACDKYELCLQSLSLSINSFDCQPCLIANNDAEEDGEDEEEELMLRQAIALSLKGVKEEGDQEIILMQPRTL